MPYVISNSSGDNIVIPDGELNQDFSIDLVGRNYPNYGSVIAKSFIDLLDNFATESAPPTRPTSGQLWYDKNSRLIRAFDGAGSWRPTGIIVSQTAPANLYNQNVRGTTYFNTTTNKLFVHDGTAYRESGLSGEVSDEYSGESALGFPVSYGTKIRNIFLEDTAGVPRAVSAWIYTNTSFPYAGGEKLIAIISGHPEFVAADQVSDTEGDQINYFTQLSESTGIGTTIVPGINFRSDDETRTPFAGLAERAETSYAINTGSPGADGGNISASDIYHKDNDIVPNMNDAYSVGESNSIFTQGYFREIVLGDGTEGAIVSHGNSVVNIGTSNSPINNITVTDITIEGDVTFPQGGDLGDSTQYIDNIYVTNVTGNVVTIDGYTLPTSAGTNGDQIYLDDTGQAFWDRRSSEIEDVIGGTGIVTVRTETSVIGANIGVDTITLSIGEGQGITTVGDNVEVVLSDFTTDDLPEGNVLYYTDARTRAAISGADGIAYDPLTGAFTLDGGEDNFVQAVVSGDGLTSIRAGSTVDLSVGQGDGIVVNASNISVSDSYVRGLISGGAGISYNSTTGVITLNSTNAFDSADITTFVRTTGGQTVAGTKTFTSDTVFNTGLTTNTITHPNTLNIVGSSATVTIDGSGTITTPGDISGLSDRTVKTNFRNIETPLDKVKQLHGQIYDRTDIGITQVGLIAQDVEAVQKESVHRGDDGLLYINQAGPVALLVEAVKELSKKLDDANKKIEELQKKLGE